MGRPPKEKIFKYFTTCEDTPPKQTIGGAQFRFGMSKKIAEKYYREWRKMHMENDTMGYNHNPWHKKNDKLEGGK